MFGSTADQVKSGKLFGTFVQYGYDTAPVTGATLEYEAGKAFNREHHPAHEGRRPHLPERSRQRRDRR